jgi:hypothetical protein
LLLPSRVTPRASIDLAPQSKPAAAGYLYTRRRTDLPESEAEHRETEEEAQNVLAIIACPQGPPLLLDGSIYCQACLKHLPLAKTDGPLANANHAERLEPMRLDRRQADRVRPSAGAAQSILARSADQRLKGHPSRLHRQVPLYRHSLERAASVMWRLFQQCTRAKGLSRVGEKMLAPSAPVSLTYGSTSLPQTADVPCGSVAIWTRYQHDRDRHWSDWVMPVRYIERDQSRVAGALSRPQLLHWVQSLTRTLCHYNTEYANQLSGRLSSD